MGKLKDEKEWLRRINNASARTETVPKETKPQSEATVTKIPKKGNGFGDVAGMNELKTMVTEGFINVLKYRERAALYGIKPPAMLFYGPAGCGKTFFAEKMAEEVGINFIKIVPDDLACTWVHGTQQKIGEVFREAEKKAPTLLFFDEFDAMVPHRTGNDINRHYDSEVNEFLCMLNNAGDRGIYVVAATNHPERIDKAILRTGRIDEMVYVDMPDREARKSMFELALSKIPSDEGIDTDRLADLTEGFNCSDIAYIVNVAAKETFNNTIKVDDVIKVSSAVLEEVISKRSPSISQNQLRDYEKVRNEFSRSERTRHYAPLGFKF